MAREPDQTAPAVVDELTPPDAARFPEQKSHDVTILVCSTCRNEAGEETSPTPGEQLFEATCAASKDLGETQNADRTVTVRSVECLGNCKRRLSAAIVTADCWTYVFGDLQIDSAVDLVTGAHLMGDTPNGLMPWRGRPQSLKSGMVARIPPLDFKS